MLSCVWVCVEMENQQEFSPEGVLSVPYCDDAFKLIDVPYLFHHPINQQDKINWANLWVRRVRLLDINGTDSADTVNKLHMYIAANQAVNRCPCERGWKLTIQMIRSTIVRMAGPFARGRAQLASIVAEEMALKKKKHDLLTCREMEHDDTMKGNGCSTRTTPPPRHSLPQEYQGCPLG